MNPTPLEKIRAACIAANPEIRIYETRCMTCGYGFEYCKCSPKRTECYKDRPIRLADVLLSIRNTNEPSKYYSGITCLGNFTEDFGEKTVWRNEEKKPISWNLRADDLEKQSEETISFLYELLK